MVDSNVIRPAAGDEATANVVKVIVPAKVAFNLDSMQKVTANVLDQLGCPECHSGFDIRFDIERRFVFDQQLRIRN